MRQKIKVLLTPPVLIAVVLVITILFAVKARGGKQAVESPAAPVESGSSAESPLPAGIPTVAFSTSTPLPPSLLTRAASTLAAMPTVPPTATSTSALPQCTFPLTQITVEASTLDEYVFSEPEVVLTAPQGNIYNIVEWLPDNQQVLITEELRNSSDGLEPIQLYNPETSELKVYAIRPITYADPAWQPTLNAVIYPVMNYFDVDRKAGTYKFTRQLWVSYGDPNTAQILADNLPQLHFALKPTVSEMVFLSDKELIKRDKGLKELSPVLVDTAHWDYAKERRSDQPVSYKMIWQPGTSLIFLYSDGAMGGGGYTFILNADTGRICELNFGGWASRARWSSDGHYLAIGRAAESHPADLTVLDTMTGRLTTLGGAPEGIEGQLFIYDFVWAPDNDHLLAIGNIISPQNSQGENDTQGLYLVAISSGQSVHVVPEHKSFVFSQDNNFAWSSDGSKLAIHCPTQTVDQICIISVQKAKQ